MAVPNKQQTGNSVQSNSDAVFILTINFAVDFTLLIDVMLIGGV